MIEILHLLVFLILAITAYFAVRAKDLLAAVVSLAGFSLALSLEFFLLHAPDVAIAEAAIGAGLTTAIYIFTIKSTKRMEEAAE
ncbi:DUF4040 domain-containing protein [Candidatus Woesearchaeota archaeon]|nr:DUF4040 domain-containing protein [Candidatus Woesearchaeota archaeon]